MNDTTGYQIFQQMEQQTYIQKRQADAMDRVARAQERQAAALEMLTGYAAQLAGCVAKEDTGLREYKNGGSTPIVQPVLCLRNSKEAARTAGALEKLAKCVTTRTWEGGDGREYAVTSLRLNTSPIRNHDHDD